MQLKFIGQGYNAEILNSVAQELINALSNTAYTDFKCLVAFSSKSGVSALTPHIRKSHIKSFKIITGIDQKATSKEALEELLTWGVDVYVYHTLSRIIFHPKVYIFEGQDEVLIITGSNNLTQTGLAQNIEGSIAITLDKRRDDTSVLNQILTYFQAFFTDPLDNNLKKLDSKLINALVNKGKVPTEARRRALYAKQEESTNIDNSADAEEIFVSTPIQPLPAGFTPSKSVVTGFVAEPEAVIATIAIPRGEAVMVEEAGDIWHFQETDNVLIAEIGGGPRWKQANFPKTIFQNFFGATAGDNTYLIHIRNVSSEGNLEEVEERQAVSVASQNYRFEIGAAGRLPYPPEGNRPIGAFIRIANQTFLYSLAMPDDFYYGELRTFLNDHYTGPERQLKRVNTNIAQLRLECLTLPFWSL